MKKIVLASFFLLLFSFSLFAEKTTEVLLRFGRQENSVRIVLQSDDEFMKNANVVTSLSVIRVEFPGQFDMKKPKDFIYEVSQRERFLSIKLRDVLEVKVLRLAAPARIVIDLKTAAQPQKEQSGTTEQKGPAAVPSAQKPSQPLPQQAPKVPPAAPQVQRPQQQKTQPAQPPTGQKAQQAVQAPEKTRRIRVVVIDAGHGGYDYGIVSSEAKEKDTDLALSKDLGNALAKRGMTVYVTRKADQYASISDRINFANSKNPDLFISIHSSLSNVFVIYASAVQDLNIDAALKPYSLVSRQNRHIEKSRVLSNSLGRTIKNDFGNVILREMPLPLLNALNAPAVLIECPSLQSVTYDQKMRERFVNSIIKGIVAYEQ